MFDLNSQRVITNIKREPGKYVTLINFADKISSTNLKVVVSTCGGRFCIVLLYANRTYRSDHVDLNTFLGNCPPTPTPPAIILP